MVHDDLDGARPEVSSNLEAMPSSAAPRLAVVVVHYRSVRSLALTLSDVARTGVPGAHVVVVDNSEDESVATQVRALLSPATKLILHPNRGYGAGVNAGVRALRDCPAEFVLVLTHEVRIGAGDIGKMMAALDESGRSDVGVVGPTILDASKPGCIWSLGGRFTEHLGLPEHVGYGERLADHPTSACEPESRAWLDGCCLLFRKQVLLEVPLREDFQLYCEEAEHHARLGRLGVRALWVPDAMVEQSSDGVPPFWLARNLPLLSRSQGRSWPVVAAATTTRLVRATASSALRGQWRDVPEYLRGLTAPRHAASVIGVGPQSRLHDLEAACRPAVQQGHAHMLVTWVDVRRRGGPNPFATVSRSLAMIKVRWLSRPTLARPALIELAPREAERSHASPRSGREVT